MSSSRLSILGFLVILLLSLMLPVQAGKFLDDYLNPVTLDQQTSLSFNQSRPFTVTPRVFIGQTFITGPDTQRIQSIAIAVDGSDEQWQPGEDLVLSLYDGVRKEHKLASFSVEYDWRQWDGSVIIFPLSVDVALSKTYYFELSVEGGDGTIGGIYASRSDYPSGRCYVGGIETDTDMWFQTGVQKSWYRDKAYRSEFGRWNLEYPGLEKVKAAVDKADWESASVELTAFYEKKLSEKKAEPGSKDDTGVTASADLVTEMKVKDSAGNICSIGPSWNCDIAGMGQSGKVAGTVRKMLAQAYRITGDTKYAQTWNAAQKSWLLNYSGPLKSGAVKSGKPVPAKGLRGIGGGCIWDQQTLESRLIEGFDCYRSFIKSPEFEPDVRIAFIFGMVDAAEVLALQQDISNGDLQESSSLLDFARAHPEMRQSEEWQRMGRDRLAASLLENTYTDGPLLEPSTEMLCSVTSKFLSMLGDTGSNGKRLSGKAFSRLENTCEFMANATLPNGLLPSWGDCGLINGVDSLKRAAVLFNRPDMLFAATSGSKGTEPVWTSKAFPESGYWIMRSGWRIDDRYMAVRNGGSGSHGHADALSFVMAAYGKDLIIDPGNNIYTPEADQLQRTGSHNTLTVDGLDALKTKGKSYWRSGSIIDYYDGMNPGYDGLDGVIHRRRIAFIRPDYWVISDAVMGKRNHAVDSRFFLRCKIAKLDPETKAGRTVFMEGGSVMITPVFTQDVNIAMDTGGAALGGDKLWPIPVYHASIKTDLPVTLGWVVTPYLAGKMPDTKLVGKRVPGSSPGVFSAAISGQGFSDGVAFGDGPDRSVSFDDGGGFAGDVVYGRVDATRRLVRLAWVNGTGFSSGGIEFAAAKKPVELLELELEDDTLYLRASKPESTLKITTLWLDKTPWFKKISVDGAEPVELSTKDEFIFPYASLAPDKATHTSLSHTISVATDPAHPE